MLKWLDTLPVRPVTKRLVESFLMDVLPSSAAVVDFGIDTPNHYRALKAVVFSDDDADEAQSEEAVDNAFRQRLIALDEALGNGAKLNALVRKYAPHYAEHVQFTGLLG